MVFDVGTEGIYQICGSVTAIVNSKVISKDRTIVRITTNDPSALTAIFCMWPTCSSSWSFFGCWAVGDELYLLLRPLWYSDIRLLLLNPPIFFAFLTFSVIFYFLYFLMFFFSFFPFPTLSATPQFLQISSSNSQCTRRPFPYPLSPTAPLFLADLCTFCWPVCLIKRCIFFYVYSLPKTQHLICVATDEVLFHNNFLVFLILYLNFFSSLRIFARIIGFFRSFC